MPTIAIPCMPPPKFTISYELEFYCMENFGWSNVFYKTNCFVKVDFSPAKFAWLRCLIRYIVAIYILSISNMYDVAIQVVIPVSLVV